MQFLNFLSAIQAHSKGMNICAKFAGKLNSLYWYILWACKALKALFLFEIAKAIHTKGINKKDSEGVPNP